MNRVSFFVTNNSGFKISGAKLHVEAASKNHISPFDLLPNEEKEVEVVIGGYADLEDSESLISTIKFKYDSGESVEIARTQEVNVGNSLLAAQILNGELVRGVGGKVQFSINNNTTVAMDLIASVSGGTSNSLRYKVLDGDENVLSTGSVKELTGEAILNLVMESQSSRLQPGANFLSSNQISLYRKMLQVM